MLKILQAKKESKQVEHKSSINVGDTTRRTNEKRSSTALPEQKRNGNLESTNGNNKRETDRNI